MWLGRSDAASSGLHHDFHDNLYALLRGTKRFRLFSPADAALMQTAGTISKVHQNGRINYEGEEPTAVDGRTAEDVAAERAFCVLRRARLAQQRAERRLSEAEEAEAEAEDAAAASAAAQEVRQAEEALDAAMDHLMALEEADAKQSSRNGISAKDARRRKKKKAAAQVCETEEDAAAAGASHGAAAAATRKPHRSTFRAWARCASTRTAGCRPSCGMRSSQKSRSPRARCSICPRDGSTKSVATAALTAHSTFGFIHQIDQTSNGRIARWAFGRASGERRAREHSKRPKRYCEPRRRVCPHVINGCLALAFGRSCPPNIKSGG